MWDKECISLLGKTAAELSVGESHEGIPSGLEHLMNKKALFNISVQPGQAKNYTGSYSVARICTDREIVKKICGEDISAQDEESVSVNASEIFDEMVGSSSKESVQSGITEVTKKSIQQILEYGESGECIVHVIVNCIEDIFGISSKVCRKELDVQDELKFFCEKCQSFDIIGMTRHKLTVRVSDCTGSGIFRLWDAQCMELLGKNTEEYLFDILPPEVEDICNKKELFTITVLHDQLSNKRGPFDVVKVEVEENTESEKQEVSLKTSKGKEVAEDHSSELNIRESIMSPKNTDNNELEIVKADDHVRRNLLDEFSATTTNKRLKRVIKKEKQ